MLLMTLISGCSQDAIHELDLADSFTLYSIDGSDHPPAEEIEASEYIAGYPVLGKVEISNPESRKALIAALRKGIADSEGVTNKCF